MTPAAESWHIQRAVPGTAAVDFVWIKQYILPCVDPILKLLASLRLF